MKAPFDIIDYETGEILTLIGEKVNERTVEILKDFCAPRVGRANELDDHERDYLDDALFVLSLGEGQPQ